MPLLLPANTISHALQLKLADATDAGGAIIFVYRDTTGKHHHIVIDPQRTYSVGASKSPITAAEYARVLAAECERQQYQSVYIAILE